MLFVVHLNVYKHINQLIRFHVTFLIQSQLVIWNDEKNKWEILKNSTKMCGLQNKGFKNGTNFCRTQRGG